MPLQEALLKVLNNEEEPLNKRIKIADEAFNASEWHLQHKEVFLIKWILNSSLQHSNGELFSLVNKWLSSKEFKDMNLNDINSEDVSVIVQLFVSKLQMPDLPVLEKKYVVESVPLLCNNNVFQNYFKHNLKLYCEILALCIEVIDLELAYVEFLAKPSIFTKTIQVEEKFSKCFLSIIYPECVKKVIQFNSSPRACSETIRVTEKCLLQRNVKLFEAFFGNLFEPQGEESHDSTLPKAIFKYLAKTLQEDDIKATTSFKLFFSAFSDCFKDALWAFKFLILLAHLLKFDICKDLTVAIPFKQKSAKLCTSLKVLLGVLEVLSAKSPSDCTFSNLSLSEFLRNALKLLISLNIHSPISYGIILNSISINPLVIEPIISALIVFVLLGNHETFKELYENVVVAIFEVFAKLHRMENFISKLVTALKAAFAENYDSNDSNVVKGEHDRELSSQEKLCVNEIFTENILEYFNKCLNGLASWQVINVFKTMLYHLKSAIGEYANDKFSDEYGGYNFLEILGILTTSLLFTAKIADHTIPQNVVDKLLKGLEELKIQLHELGSAILKREHNHITMRTFLSLAHAWAEIHLTLSFYSTNNEVQIVKVIDNSYVAANLRYLHSYMDLKQWQLIAQRITNFGEYPCKKLMQKLYIQKWRAFLLFEENLSEDIEINIVKALQIHLEDTWRDLYLDKFTSKIVFPKMDKVSLVCLAERLIENDNLIGQNHLLDSLTLINATVYVLFLKINKLFKMKRKPHSEQKSLSCKVFAMVPDEVFFGDSNRDLCEVFGHIMKLQENWECQGCSSIESKQDKLHNYLRILEKLPFIYSADNVLKMVLLYLWSLNIDTLNCSRNVRTPIENLIIGTLQASKFPLREIFSIKALGAQALANFLKCEVPFLLVLDNIFKHEQSILSFDPLLTYTLKNLDSPMHLTSCIWILQAVTKVKKVKFESSTKEKLSQIKETILSKLSKFVISMPNYSIEAYATCLKHHLSSEKESETQKMLLDKASDYLEHSLDHICEENKRGCAILFGIVLQNKNRIPNVDSDAVLKIWNACKKVNLGEEHSHLVKLVVTLIPNEEFEMMMKDLFNLTDNSIKNGDYSQVIKQLKTWEFVLTCDMNSTKMKICQEALESLTYELLHALKTVNYHKELYESIVHLEQVTIQAPHFLLSPPLIDMFITTTSVLMKQEEQHFNSVFVLSISTLEALLKYRNALIMDRLPAFLQQFRVLLVSITARSNSDAAVQMEAKKASDCAHAMEKLTKNLVNCKKDMSRIAVFLIADILKRYEQINLYPNVKLHLTNCVYSLISVCDHHAVSYLMRVLSSASTEMFKIMYDHYKKYYMFTGKV